MDYMTNFAAILKSTKSMKRMLTAFALLVFAAESVFAQNISVRAGQSTLLYDDRYFPGLFADKTPTVPSLNVKFGWEDHSSSPYASICRHPEYGIALDIECLGDAAPAASSQGMGNIYGLYGYFDRDYVKTRSFSLGYSAGLGVGIYASKFRDPVLNPWNWMISLPINGFATLGIDASYIINDMYSVGASAYFNHCSNGALNFQNKGYNGYGVGLTFSRRDPSYRSVSRPSFFPGRRGRIGAHDRFRPHFQFDLQASGGIMAVEKYFDRTEYIEGVGRNIYKFKYSFNADCLYKYTRTCASGIGLDLFVTPFSGVIAENEMMLAEAKGNPGTVSYEPVSYGISLLHEFCYRTLTTTVGVGRYIKDNDGLAQNKILYQFVNVKYHFPQFNDIYCGVLLKAHKFKAAESVQFSIGKRF